MDSNGSGNQKFHYHSMGVGGNGSKVDGVEMGVEDSKLCEKSMIKLLLNMKQK